MLIIIISITSIASISVSFVAFLNCLYLSPQVSPFVRLCSPSHWGRRGGMSERLPGASCWLPG